MNLFKNIHFLLITVLILAIILSQIFLRETKETLQNCTGLTKSQCTDDPEQADLCDYFPERCNSCYRKKCSDITTKDVCVFTNQQFASNNPSAGSSEVIMNTSCPDQTSDVPSNDQVKCADCKNGLVQDPTNGECKVDPYLDKTCTGSGTSDSCVHISNPKQPSYITYSDGSQGVNSYYRQSCKINPSGENQPFSVLPKTFTTTDGKSIIGNSCQETNKGETDYVCPDNFFKITANPPAYSENAPINYVSAATVGRCVPNHNYVLIEKPTTEYAQQCSGPLSGFVYNSDTGNCEPRTDIPNGNYTCDPGNIMIGKNNKPWVLNQDTRLCVPNTSNKYLIRDYICPEGQILSKWNKSCIAAPILPVDEYKAPCTWNPKAKNPKKKCGVCPFTITDPKSKNILCFVDKKNNPICEHRSYKPNKIQCETTLVNHCRWSNGQCKPKRN